MILKLDCVFAETDSYGKIKKEVKDSFLTEQIDGMEMEGVSFSAKTMEGGVEVLMDGDNLSEEIKPNYSGKPGGVVLQVGFKKDSGRKTANTLNMFLRRVNKILIKNGQAHTLLVKAVEMVNE